MANETATPGSTRRLQYSSSAAAQASPLATAQESEEGVGGVCLARRADARALDHRVTHVDDRRLMHVRPVGDDRTMLEPPAAIPAGVPVEVAATDEELRGAGGGAEFMHRNQVDLALGIVAIERYVHRRHVVVQDLHRRLDL